MFSKSSLLNLRKRCIRALMSNHSIGEVDQYITELSDYCGETIEVTNQNKTEVLQKLIEKSLLLDGSALKPVKLESKPKSKLEFPESKLKVKPEPKEEVLEVSEPKEEVLEVSEPKEPEQETKSKRSRRR